MALFAVGQYSFIRVHASIIEEEMRVALVLSAGGMFGSYQLGAWEVLEEFLQPDIVVGTSIGSLNAWAIAGGATSADLLSLWHDPSLSQAFQFQFPRGLRHGLLQPQGLEGRIRRMHESFTPNRAVGVVANAYPNIQPHLFRDGEITWQHLAASCALPLFLPQPQIGGLTFTDGGLFDSVNVWAAFAMGATHVVVVNCWKPQQPWIINRPMGWMAARRRQQRKQANGSHPVPARKVVVIEPSGQMGRMRDGLLWQREQIEEWRKRGQDDAQAAKQNICDMF